MKNFKTNPAANLVNVTIPVEVKHLTDLGWQIGGIGGKKFFDEYYRVQIRILKDHRGFRTLVSLSYTLDPSFIDTEETGDDSATIEDMMQLLNSGKISPEDIEDWSTDENDVFVNFFIEA